MTIKKYFSKGVAALLIMISMLCCFSFTACGGDEEVSNVVASETTGTVLIELNIKNAVANRIESKFYVYEDSAPSVYIDSLEINNNSYTASGTYSYQDKNKKFVRGEFTASGTCRNVATMTVDKIILK